MNTSTYRDEKIKKMKRLAALLYKNGVSLKGIALHLKEKEDFTRSYEWVRLAIRELSPVSKS